MARTLLADADAADPLIGRDLCGYIVRRKLAEGGMGVVYEGVHPTLGRLGAIKVLRPELCQSNAVVERFHQEARAVNAIRHQNIVDITDFGRDQQGRVFFVMEFLEGEPLSARIRRGPLPWAEALPILHQTLRALKAAHDRHFVHRDLKPDNIWLKPADGQVTVKLLDFGIAKLVGADAPGERLTKTGSMIGTPAYMSPEQINGAADVDHRTDIYALGVILYEMFAGVTPYPGQTLQAIIAGHLFTPPPRLTNLPAGVPPGIADLIDRMLIKDPAARCSSVAEVEAALEALDAGRAPALRAAAVGQGGTRLLAPREPVAAAANPRPARRGLTAALMMGLLAAGIGGWRWWTHRPVAPVAVAPAPTAALDFGALRRQMQGTLRGALKEKPALVRVQAADALGKVKDQPSVAPLSDLTEHDPDAEVRGHSAAALGAIGDPSPTALLARLETAAPPPLKVWYAAALARLGNAPARHRLLAYAGDSDLAVSFSAGLMLADLSAPGDVRALDALKAIVAHEGELTRRDPYAGVTLAMKLAALRDPGARKYLSGLLDHLNEGVRIAAAEALAKLGDGAGRNALLAVLANPASPNRLTAALAQIPLGDTGGLPVITQAATDPAPENRRLAAEGLGAIGDRRSLPALITLAGDPDWTVRIAAARGILEIVGLDPAMLERASVDWTRSALDSQDLAVRRSAAGVLGDIPSAQALPLLARAVLDKDPAVRRAASRSAGRIKTAAAAAQLAQAARLETDASVKEQQVRALGAIGTAGGALARDTLARISAQPGRIGLLAAGSLIAAGDTGGKARLDAALATTDGDLHRSAIEAAVLAGNPIVVPTLRLGLTDRLFQVRLLAAQGLALFGSDKEAAMPVLNEALGSRDTDVFTQAIAALIRFGDRVKELARTSGELLESPDPARRMAAAPIARALPSSDAVPLIRRLIADPDPDVRRAGVDVIEHVSDTEEAIRLYKPLLTDADPAVRAKAAGQLARLLPPVPGAPVATAPPAVVPDATLPAVQQAMAAERTAVDTLERQNRELEAALADLARAVGGPAHGDATLDQVRELKGRVEHGLLQAADATGDVDRTAQAVGAAAGATPSPEAARLTAEGQTLAQRARDASAALRERSAVALRKAGEFVSEWTGDAQLDIDAANAKSAVGDLAGARRSLDRAAHQLHKSGRKSAALDFAYAQLFEKMADDAQGPAARRDLLERALDAYRRVARTGGRFQEVATARVTKLTDQVNELARP